jgi:ADP-heptose:LPS heptosyltransferase
VSVRLQAGNADDVLMRALHGPGWRAGAGESGGRRGRHLATTLAGLAGSADLLALARAVAAAGRVVCGDTGVAHLASAHRTPSVVVFGPVAPALWGPPAAGPHTVVWRGGTREARGGRGDPHGTELDAALVATDVADVIDAVRDRLQDTGAQDPTWGAATLRRW